MTRRGKVGYVLVMGAVGGVLAGAVDSIALRLAILVPVAVVAGLVLRLWQRRGDDIKTPLRTYARVIRQDEDRVRSIVDGVLAKDAEDWSRTEVA